MILQLTLIEIAIELLPSVNYVQRRCKAKFKDGGAHATFNDLPIPEGSWKQNYDNNQKTFWVVLLSGIAAFVGSVYIVATSDRLKFNYTIPDYPYEDEKEGEEGS
ncbi:hypothetical protein DOY81_003578 [Sarcophaga bullata]|nr:hypothetical protein DOY81_003578 [Sarcophaga bullata]